MHCTLHDYKVLTQSAHIPTCFDGGYFSESTEKYLGIYAKVFWYDVGVLKDIAIGRIHFTAP
jgi:hypothetical protein